jgi:glucoamylase
MAAVANNDARPGDLPEQVWGQNPPSGQPGFVPGPPTFSATPLAWTHAQLIRLAWSISAGRPVEQPALVASGSAPEPSAQSGSALRGSSVR